MKGTLSATPRRGCCSPTGRSDGRGRVAVAQHGLDVGRPALNHCTGATPPVLPPLSPRERILPPGSRPAPGARMFWKHTAAAIAVALGVAACRDAAAPRQDVDGLIGLPFPSGQYIVVFRDEVADPASLARQLVQAYGGSLSFTYTKAIKGFAATLPELAAQALALNPLVASVERDQVYHTDETQAMDANGDPWGLDRIDQQALPLSATYDYTATGAGVNVYIIDTGIWTAHPDFGGRADNVYDALTFNLLGGESAEDCNGHGTHVAGTVGGTTYGVAKGVSLHGVRVLSCAGVGFTSQIIAGLDWVSQNFVAPAVANMSLGGGKSDALDAATTSLWDAGVFVAVAAGNDDADACQRSEEHTSELQS